MGNATLNRAKNAKQDDFWTQLSDIEAECAHYRDHFRGKTILCNCDDPAVSNFFRYFALNFRSFGLKRLITTCYRNAQGLLFSQGDTEKAVYLDCDGSERFNSVEELVHVKRKPLPEGCDGDFRHPDCVALLKQADLVVTNPPFSLFREYIAQLVEHGKRFLIIGNLNAVKYKEIFPLIQQNRLWLGYTGGKMKFQVPSEYGPRKTRYWVEEDGSHWRSLGNSLWFTNLDIPKLHEPIPLWAAYTPERYPSYVNFNAIEVDKVSEIPRDYDGMMGVPITFLDKYCPEQFEIVGQSLALADMDIIRGMLRRNDGGPSFYIRSGNGVKRLYDRIVIRRRK